MQMATNEALRDMFADMLRVGGKAVSLLESVIDNDQTAINAKLRATQIALQHIDNYFELVTVGDELDDIKRMLEEVERQHELEKRASRY